MSLFAAIVILFVLIVAYFHYLQGLFSATLSAIFAVVAAVLAVGYQENIVSLISRGGMADQAASIAIVVVFAAVYLILRIIFDSLIPGNVRFPVTLDRVGSAMMGLIAGIFATGVIVIAAEALPFGPSIAGYSRYPLETQRVVIRSTHRGAQDIDTFAYDMMHSPTFDPDQKTTMLLPVDDIVVGMVAHLSDAGALAGAQPFTAIHPNYLQELFGNRLGIQPGAKRSLLNDANHRQVQAREVYRLDKIPQTPGEFETIHPFPKNDLFQPPAGQTLLVIRVLFDKNAADSTDGIFRFSPASSRLVLNGRDYYPVGAIDDAQTMRAAHIDDFWFIQIKNEPRGADLVYVVDSADLAGGANPKLPEGTFLEIKRSGPIDLSGRSIGSSAGYHPSADIGLMRKTAPLKRR